MGQEISNFTLVVDALFRGETINFVDDGNEVNDDTLSISSLKFYISAITLLNEDAFVYKEPNSYHLWNSEDIESQTIELSCPYKNDFTHIQFHLGIDSLTHMEGVMGDDLDPIHGMYWTWQSGYINFKLEGRSKHCPTRNNEFAFHLGGYAFPNNALQTIKLPLTKNENTSYNIAINLGKFFDQVDLTKQNQVMSPGTEAIALSQMAGSIFSISP